MGERWNRLMAWNDDDTQDLAEALIPKFVKRWYCRRYGYRHDTASQRHAGILMGPNMEGQMICSFCWAREELW